MVLKQEQDLVNIYIYEIRKSINISNYPTLEIFLFAAVSLIKNADISKYKYSGYGTGFDKHESFSSPCIGLGRNVRIFGVDMSSSTKVDNRKKDILILGTGPTQEQKKCIRLILQSIIKSSVYVCIIMEQTVIY